MADLFSPEYLSRFIRRDTERLDQAILDFQRLFKEWNILSPLEAEQQAAVMRARKEIDRLEAEIARWMRQLAQVQVESGEPWLPFLKYFLGISSR